MGYWLRYIYWELFRIKTNWRNRIFRYQLFAYILAIAALVFFVLGIWYIGILLVISLGYYLYRVC